MAIPRICRACGKDQIYPAPSRTWFERGAELLSFGAFQCQGCRRRFLARRPGPGYAWGPVERRQHKRIPVRLALSFSGGRIKGTGTALDISMGGCVIQSETRVQVDEIFYLELDLDDGLPPIEVAAMVRSTAAGRIHFKFLRAARENRRLFAYLHSKGG